MLKDLCVSKKHVFVFLLLLVITLHEWAASARRKLVSIVLKFIFSLWQVALIFFDRFLPWNVSTSLRDLWSFIRGWFGSHGSVGFFAHGFLAQVTQTYFDNLHLGSGKSTFYVLFVFLLFLFGASAPLLVIFESLAPFTFARDLEAFEVFDPEVTLLCVAV